MTARQTIQPVADTIRKVTDPVKAQIKKPDHPFWRKVGNFFVMVVAPVGAVLTEMFVPAEYRQVTQIAIASVSAFVKAGSKLTEKK